MSNYLYSLSCHFDRGWVIGKDKLLLAIRVCSSGCVAAGAIGIRLHREKTAQLLGSSRGGRYWRGNIPERDWEGRLLICLCLLSLWLFRLCLVYTFSYATSVYKYSRGRRLYFYTYGETVVVDVVPPFTFPIREKQATRGTRESAWLVCGRIPALIWKHSSLNDNRVAM